MNKCYVATYATRNGDHITFGNVGGVFHHTIGDAENAINNDIKEFQVGMKNPVLVKHDTCWTVREKDVDNVFCVWGIQELTDSLEGMDDIVTEDSAPVSETDATRRDIRKFLDWQTWDSCDNAQFAWAIDRLPSLFANFFNKKFATKEREIIPMKEFINLLVVDCPWQKAWINEKHICQSVISFYSHDIAQDMMGEFDFNSPYARLGSPDDEEGRLLPISMNNEDIGYWLNVHNKFSVDELVDFIYENLKETEIDGLHFAMKIYILENAWCKKIFEGYF